LYLYFLDLFNNVVTFRKLDSQIRLPTYDFGQNGDIYFEFKTTIENAVIFESHGPKDYIKLSLISMKIDFFLFILT
jgi:hypothetical protein